MPSGCPSSVALPGKPGFLSNVSLLLLVFGISCVPTIIEAQRRPSETETNGVSDSRIVGGVPAGIFLARSMGHLIIAYRDVSFSGLCSATVVAPRWILTAAHCFAGPTSSINVVPSMTYAFIGEQDAQLRLHNTHKQPYWAQSIHVHKNFKPGSDDHKNDIALVFLNRPIPEALYSPVRLARGPLDTPLDGMSVSSAGYGVRSENGLGAQVLMKTSLLLKPFALCADTEHPYFRQFLRNWAQVCAVSVGWPHVGQTDTCYGDSGGPLFHIDKATNTIVQFGITSFGTSPCAAKGSVSWYTRVAAHFGQVHQRVFLANGTAWNVFL